MSTAGEHAPGATRWVAIGLGGNIGDVRAVFERVIPALAARGIVVERRSALYRSRAWGVEDQADFLNAAVLARTAKGPRAVLEDLLAIERAFGRERVLRWGPRTLDLDLLLMQGTQVDEPGLTLPHPGIASRDFVLAPLMDLEVEAPAELGNGGWAGMLQRLSAGERVVLERVAW